MRTVIRIGLLIVLLCIPGRAFPWGREGHRVIAIIAEKHMYPDALVQANEILGGVSLEEVANWADDYRSRHPETGPWHYINIPLGDDRIDLERECPEGACVTVKIKQFIAVLKNPHASQSEKAQALKFLVHLVGDLHQPLHCEDDHDRGGNTRQVIHHGHPDNPHWVWDNGLVLDINRGAYSLATDLEGKITPEEEDVWREDTIEDWALQSHKLARTVAYRYLKNPPTINRVYGDEVDSTVELQLERAGVRLAYLLNESLP